jgi:hypothetical protein
MSALAPTLQAWFTNRLIAQRNVSPHTIRAYRDTLRCSTTPKVGSDASHHSSTSQSSTRR